MINYIWSLMLVVSFGYSFFSGGLPKCTAALAVGAQNGVALTLTLLGVMCFWSGIMEIAKRAGIVLMIERALRPVMRLLFKDVPVGSDAMNAIVMNISANLFGMGNAATPLGLRAMGELDRLNRRDERASDAMCAFVVVNTASIQIIPATLLALRVAANSAAPNEIMLPVWITSAAALLGGIFAAKMLEKTT